MVTKLDLMRFYIGFNGIYWDIPSGILQQFAINMSGTEGIWYAHLNDQYSLKCFNESL